MQLGFEYQIPTVFRQTNIELVCNLDPQCTKKLVFDLLWAVWWQTSRWPLVLTQEGVLESPS